MWTFFVFFGNRRGEGARKIANAVGGGGADQEEGQADMLAGGRAEPVDSV